MSIKELLIEAGTDQLLMQDECTQDYLQTIVDYIDENFEVIIINKKDIYNFNLPVLKLLVAEIVKSEKELNKVTDEDYIYHKAQENRWLNS